MKFYSTLILFLFSISLISCSKDEDDTTPLEGEYKFIGVTADMYSSNEMNVEGAMQKAVAKMAYVSDKNSGSINFVGARVVARGISYHIKTTLYGEGYVDGELVDTTQETVDLTMPLASSEAKFKMIGTDSIYFESGSIFMSSNNPKARPTGAKLRYEGDKIILDMIINDTQNVTQNDVKVVSKTNNKVK